MAAAAGKRSTTSLSLFMEVYDLLVEDEICTMATQFWAEGVWTGKWSHEQKEAWIEADSRGSNMGAVMCETRDLGARWPQWHTLVFSDEKKLT